MVRVVVVRVVVVRTQNFVRLAARGSGPRARVTIAKFSYVMPRVVLVRTQNILSPAALGSGSRGSGARVSGTKEKFPKSSHAWY